MRRFVFSLAVIILVFGLGATPCAQSAETNATPDFKEVYDLIKAHVTGMSDAELNKAAVRGLLSVLGPRVTLVTNEFAGGGTNTPATLGVSVFDGGMVLLRIPRLAPGLSSEITAAYQRVSATNKIQGIVLDLRYSDGADYPQAAAVADLFVAKAAPLVNWNGSVISSHGKTNAVRLPVAVLVNRETSRAAEALAAMVRETGVGLILGSKTAGQAMLSEDFPLSSGGQLRIATASVTLGDGSALPASGVRPDIEVNVNPDDERAYYADAFVVLPRTNAIAGAAGKGQAQGTNEVMRRPLNEAELVREHKEGLDRDEEPDRPQALLRGQDQEPEKPMVNDPVLARALDLLRGLAVVRQGRS